MRCDQMPRFARTAFPAFILVALLLGTLAATGNAQEVLTNDSIVGMVKAGFSESVILAKIRASQSKFDTSTNALMKLKADKVPDKVIEAMITGGAPPAASAAAAPGDPAIAHVTPGGAKPLKLVNGEMEVSVAPFAGSRQEVVLPASKAEYRITDKQPSFTTNLAADQWALVRLKPGKKDRNVPISNNAGWGWGGTSFRTGPDPKYRVTLEGGPAADGTTQIRPKDPLQPGEYGLVSIVRGQPNMVQVFEFGID